ncbi:MAG: TonB-dependent receptor [Hyphomonadaceae bacterium]
MFEGDIQHRVVYGIDYSVTNQSAIRDGAVPTPPAAFPERPFPETEYERTGVFLIDEIALLDGSLMLLPSVRYDQYELTPHDDALYNGLLAGQDDDHISPRFGIVAWPLAQFGVFFNYATGFKAPAPSEVNNFFENLTLAAFNQAYTSIPNPDLRPETSEGAEAGIRGRNWSAAGGDWNWSATAYSTWFEDFISQEIVSGSGTALDPFVYQYINLSEVQIDGVEARIDGAWANGFGISIAASYAEGTQDGAPLQSIDPLKVVAGLSFSDPDGRFGGQFIVTYAARKEGDLTAANAYRPDAFAIVDFTTYWHLSENATLRAGVFNATDESYAWWSDARGLTTASTVLDAYTQPGRNYSVSLAYRF